MLDKKKTVEYFIGLQNEDQGDHEFLLKDILAKIMSGDLDKKFDFELPAEESAINEILRGWKEIKGLATSSLEIVKKILKGQPLTPPAKIEEEKKENPFDKLGGNVVQFPKRKIEQNLTGVNSPFHRK